MVTNQALTVDILIIGGGMAGTATAYYLSQYFPGKTALLERYSIGNDKSSSFGEERMYRRMYSDAYLSDLQTLSLQEWRQIETKHQCSLLRENGLLFYGEVWDEETIEGSILGAKKVMEEKSIPFVELNAPQMQRRWPIQPRPNFIGLYEPTAGMVWVNRALQTFRTQAQNQGVAIYEGETVIEIQSNREQSFLVKTQTGRLFHASKLILTAGAYTNDLLSSLGYRLNLEIWNMLWGYYRIEASLRELFPQWFCFQRANSHTGDGGLYYGFPCHRPQEGLIKVGIDWCPPERRTQSMQEFNPEPEPKLVQFLEQFLRHNWRGIQECVSLHCCPYTMTPDTLFILDKLPNFPNIALFTGGSGQAFKFAPIIGKLLTELILDKDPSVNIEPISINRERIIIHPN